jgi:hypothetical protein
MTPRQSLTRKQSHIRRSLALLSAALLTAAWAVGISIPASAAVKGSLEIVSVTTSDRDLCPNADMCAILQNQQFTVRVRVLDNDGEPTTVSKDTTIVLEKLSGEGSLVPDGSVVTIPRNGSEATFGLPPDAPLTYTQSANPTLRVRVTSGVQLNPDDITLHIAITAVGEPDTARSLNIVDQNCEIPTPERPTCGHWLLPNGAQGPIVMSVGSCDGIGPPQSPSCRSGDGGVNALVVTALGDLGDLYSKNAPATMILACDKVICGGTGVPKLPVIYGDNTGPLDKVALPCPAKGVIGAEQEKCVDYVSSMRSQGDLYLFVLFNVDARFSG